MGKQKLTGIEFMKKMCHLVPNKTDRFGWQIPRTQLQNENFHITGLVITAYLNNTSIGEVLKYDLNLILTIHPIEGDNMIEFYDVIYKNDIFVFCLGENWIYNSDVGTEYLLNTFNLVNYVKWIEYQIKPIIFINLNNGILLDQILQRFKNIVLYYPLKNPSRSEKITTSLFIITEEIEIHQIPNNISLIFTMKLTQNLRNYCMKNGIYLILLDNNQVLNEITRDLSYSISSFLKINTHFTSLKTQKIQILNGLDGI